MKTLLRCLVAALFLCGVRAMSQVPDPWCDVTPEPQVEQIVKLALQSEALTIDGVSTLPLPIPSPTRAVAKQFQKIGVTLIKYRSASLVSTLPLPIPSPSDFRKAASAQKRALVMAMKLEDKINRAVTQGDLDAATARSLRASQGNLVDLISGLPVPLP